MSEGSTGGTDERRRSDLVELLRDLAALRDSGVLTEDELQRARASAVAMLRGEAATASQRAR